MPRTLPKRVGARLSRHRARYKARKWGDPQNDDGEEQAVLDRAPHSHLREPLDQVRCRRLHSHEQGDEDEGNNHEDAAQHARQAAP